MKKGKGKRKAKKEGGAHGGRGKAASKYRFGKLAKVDLKTFPVYAGTTTCSNVGQVYCSSGFGC